MNKLLTALLKGDVYLLFKLWILNTAKGSPLGECKAKGIEKPCFLSYYRDFHIRLARDHNLQI